MNEPEVQEHLVRLLNAGQGNSSVLGTIPLRNATSGVTTLGELIHKNAYNHLPAERVVVTPPPLTGC